MNIVVGNEYKQDVGSSSSLTTGTFYTLNAGDSISNNAASFISHYATESFTNTIVLLKYINQWVHHLFEAVY